VGRFFEQMPQEGKPISMKGLARGLRGMAYALEHMDCTGGRVDWSAFGVPTIVPFREDGANELGEPGTPEYETLSGTPTHVLCKNAAGEVGWVATGSTPHAGDASFDGAEITVTEFVFMRGPVTVHTSSVSLNLTLDTAYIAARVTLSTHAVTLIEGASIAAVTDADLPTDDDYVKILLYKVARTPAEGETPAGPYSIVWNYRTVPQLGVAL
jgi:hypothetical protein